MPKQGLVTLARREEFTWEPIETASGTFRITRPFDSRNCPTVGGGICELNAAEMAWTPNYDEIVTVLSGELVIEHSGTELTARMGDMVLIRYGAEIVYRSRTKCAFSWVLSPANWQSLRWPE